MSGAHAESVIKNIIRAIVQQCAARGHAVSDTLVAFMVKAVVLDPRNGFNVDRTLTKQDVQKLEELCLGKLMEECSPSLDTIKMQVHFDMNYTSRPALQSVFPQTELGAFMVLLKRDKEQQLRELTMIVTGIRLFNKASKKGGEETDLQELMPSILNEALPVTSKSIEKELSVSQTLAWRYTSVLEKQSDSQPAECDPPAVLLKQALYNVRQHEVFLKMLLADACLCAKHVEMLQTALSSQMKLLKETIQAKTAVPTANVFPRFKSLSELWSALQDEAQLLNILRSILLSLQPFTASQAKIFSEACVDGLLEAAEVKTDQQRMAESADERIVPAEMNTQEWLLPETTTSFDELPLQYNGVCGYSLVTRDGLLLPGYPHIGVFHHEEKLYVFSSKEAALTFASSPGDFIAEVAEKAKLSPELIQLLQLHRQFSCVSPYSELQPGESLLVKPITKCESGTQTDIHPLETNIDKSYEWNEWELRRKAIKLADLRTKETRSMQTDLSHMRRETATQTWPPKDAATQSKRDGDSSVPRPQVYLAGLRGQRDAHVVQTNLTRPVDQ
ncbi:cilia- and flagella-associated protein 206 isoform X2 [Gymnodraco acuticeps]|uniref:Cilia- and flagella-associated protein 206 n=1 Tax=Gymnodraco acuticeps TaxID=8218 RepID=A0A6P8TQL1_GYMAC|nr:cilia- and flagella-associated protein 206 isoform X2 [Gymnodraco acuticeps]